MNAQNLEGLEKREIRNILKNMDLDDLDDLYNDATSKNLDRVAEIIAEYIRDVTE